MSKVTQSPPPPEQTDFQGTLQQFAFQAPMTPSPVKRNSRLSSALRSQTQLRFPIKREASEDTASSPSSSAKKPKRSPSGYAPPSKYSHITNLLTDKVAPNLICLFIGVNPGIRTATTGHAYSHPSNLFWKLLHSSGCTPRRCAPTEDGDLPRLFSLGNTNIVTRTTKDASELSKAEMDAGVAVLEEKIRKWKPEAVAIVGKGIWESVWRVKHGRGIKKEEFRYGWQDERWGIEDGWDGARVFVTTTTSGLAAGMRPHEKEEVWRGLGEWVERRRAERKGDSEAAGEVKQESLVMKEESRTNETDAVLKMEAAA